MDRMLLKVDMRFLLMANKSESAACINLNI